ncbi:MAG: Asp23/Gls24 family envelope stress response protein [Candidatus Brocadiia bacterium]
MGKHQGQAVVVNAPAEVGSVTIADEVLLRIARTEALSVDGVVPPLEHSVPGVFRRGTPRQAWVDRSEKEVAFHLTLGVRSGRRIPDVATEVRRRVVAAVREKTGFRVRAVNVRVDHLVFEEASPGAS